MLDIIICEDNTTQRKNLESIIENEVRSAHIKIALSTNNPNEVIQYVQDSKSQNFIYFLDIDLQSNINGLELSKILRQHDPMGYIVFLTSHAELTLLTFQYKVRAMDFIIKADTNMIKDRIVDCINEAFNDLKNIKVQNTNTIPINIGNNITFFDMDDILFFETSSKEHKIRIHTTSGHSEFYGSLKDIETKLSSDFYKPHRSYIVNTKKIKSIDKDQLIINMINGEICYVSSRYLKGLLKKCML
ncbi:two component transcriptional regulator, LytTR family [Clostridium bornimense]|uniref:Stage 0 sporulation protein A homolog n=1 Tax=Clostridium bornimense TaxID=1216932 RepID=W6RX06_9CLOT|nr:LytTR family DNA-binding domain-containing protein [Clostridium bornimense]CDM68169.1 two component transcriptional regulator, LytTR family [Clostridium bornimense]